MLVAALALATGIWLIMLVSGEEPKMSSREFSAAGGAMLASSDMVVAGDGGVEFAELESVCVDVISR